MIEIGIATNQVDWISKSILLSFQFGGALRCEPKLFLLAAVPAPLVDLGA